MEIPLDERLISEGQTVYIQGEINISVLSNIVPALLLHREKLKGKTLIVVVHSIGGILEDTFLLYDLLTDMGKEMKVVTVAGGYCYSGAVLLLQAGQLRLALPNSSLHIHEIQFAPPGEDSLNNFISSVNFTKKLQRRFFDILIEKSKGKLSRRTLTYYLRKYQDWWLTAQEALRYGLIDAIIGQPDIPSLSSLKERGDENVLPLPSERG